MFNQICFYKYIPSVCSLPFPSINSVFQRKEVLNFKKSNLPIFFDHDFVSYLTNFCPNLESWIWSSAEFCRAFKKERIPILHKVFHKIDEERIHLNSLYGTSITLIPKSHKDTANKENYRTVSIIYIYVKILHKILTNQTQQYIEGIIYHGQVGLILKCKVVLTFENQSVVFIPLTVKNKKYIIISVGAENHLTKSNLHSWFGRKNQNKPFIRVGKGNFFNQINDINKNPTANVILSGERSKIFS